MQTCKQMLFVVAISCAVIALSGCGVSNSYKPSYIPADSYQIGGGAAAKVKPDQPGTLYLVDIWTDRILLSTQLDAGEDFQYKQEELGELLLLTDSEIRALNRKKLVLFFAPEKVETPGYLPDEKYIIGGGFVAKIKAEQPGTVMLVDSASKKILVTAQLGVDGSFGYEPDDIKSMLVSFDIDRAKAEPVLYFIPSETQERSSENAHQAKVGA